MAWYPLREMDALRREIDQVLAGFESGREPGHRVAFLPGRSARTYPLINVSEDADALYVRALAPGVAPEVFEISVHHDTLTIAGEKPGIGDVPAEAYHRCERAAGRFVKTVELPVEVNADGISAKCAEGVVTITLPKAAVAKPRRIAVASA